MKRIAIIGKGTAGALTASHFKRWLKDFEVEWYYDPEIKVQAVGEGSNLVMPFLLNKNVEFSHDKLKFIDGTFKHGIYKKNWGSKNQDFFHNFHGEYISYHFNALKLQDFIFNYLKNKVKIFEKNVRQDDIDADYIIDCSGKPSSMDDFFESEVIPVNSVYVTQCFWDYEKFQYTLTEARPYGWVFGIPLKNRCSIGYLYNNKINCLDEIKEDVKEVFRENDLTPSEITNFFSFNNYFRKNNFSKRIAYNGNSSFFLEPLEATSFSTIDYISRSFFDIITNNHNIEQTNLNYLSYLREIENMIAVHYFAGSKFKTKFWSYANEKSEKRINEILYNDENFLKVLYLSQKKNLDIRPGFGYATWPVKSWYDNLLGLGFNWNDKELLKNY